MLTGQKPHEGPNRCVFTRYGRTPHALTRGFKQCRRGAAGAPRMGRSGDKGNKAISIIARKADYLPYVEAALDDAAIRDRFGHFG